MTDTLHTVPVSDDSVNDKLDRILRVIEGYDDGRGTRRRGISERLEAVERIVVFLTTVGSTIVTAVSAAWFLLWYGPHVK